jgi:hypothetical protein
MKFPRKDKLTLSVALLVALCCWWNTVGLQKSHLDSLKSVFPSTHLEVSAGKTASNPKLELQVPFFVYDNDLNWINATFDRLPFPERGFSIATYKKHSDDYWLLLASLKHPMRTLNAEEAKLFFVPTLLNVVSAMALNEEARKLCVQQKKCFDSRRKKLQPFEYVDSLLGKSPYFQNSKGANHIIVASHFTSRIFADFPNIQKCHHFIFETKVTGSMSGYDQPKANSTSSTRLRLPSMYIGNPCPRNSTKTHDFALIAQMIEADPANHRYPLFQSRRDICSWLSLGNFSTSHCGSGAQQCPHLSNARYGFHVRGDSWGSNRLMDTLQSGTVPLFTNEEQYKILPDILPWREFSYLVNATSFDSFQASLERLLDLPESDYIEKARLIERFQPVFQPQHIFQFDRMMASLATKLNLH